MKSTKPRMNFAVKTLSIFNRGVQPLVITFFLLLLMIPVQAEEFTLTIDLCQSHKPYEARLFTYLETLGKRMEKPVPVALCVAGKWLEKHPKELAAIKKDNLAITWVNHSLTHPVANDFLNDPTVNFTREVEGNIALMKAAGLRPSKYFRFPGLRHNQERLNELAALGYVNLDADAWLAKGETIKDHSIVLVHGNGNEPKGVDLLLAYLKANDAALISGKLKIVPLSAK